MVSYLNDSPLKFIEIRPTRFSISHLVTFYTLKRRCYTVALWSASRKTIYAFQAQSSTSKIFGQAIGIRIRIRIPKFPWGNEVVRRFQHFTSFLSRELRACATASCRYDVENGTHSLDWSIPVNFFFFYFRLLSAFDSFWRVINKRNGDLCC